MKYCKLCEQNLPFEEFGKHAGHKDGLQNYCRVCRNHSNREMLTPEQKTAKKLYNQSYADRRISKRREWRYGITEEHFQKLKLEQGNLCYICKGSETYEHKELCVDHDHVTGKVRGLLCSRCNKALGGFKDSIEILKSAIEYLEKHNL